MNTEKIAIILAKNIRQQEPTLDLEGADRKVLQVALQDLTNYITYIQNQHQQINTEETSEQASTEIASFFNVWTGMWLKKWNQRFSLLIGENPAEAPKNPQASGKDGAGMENFGCREELTQLIISALIKNSEICGTKIIAEDILQKEAKKVAGSDINSRETTFKLLNAALSRVREIAQSTTPVVYIRVQKSYYCNCNCQLA
jgi:hypothetical protein